MMILLLGARVELRGWLGGRRRRHGCCGEGRSCSYLLGFPGCTYHTQHVWHNSQTIETERQSFTTEARVQYQVSPRGLCGGRNDTGTDRSVSWCSRFPCHYHCSSTPNRFSNLPPLLCNVSN